MTRAVAGTGAPGSFGADLMRGLLGGVIEQRIDPSVEKFGRYVHTYLVLNLVGTHF